MGGLFLIALIVIGRCIATLPQNCNFSYFTQAVDHFGSTNDTFQQKFNLVTDFYQPGGPIMLFHGEESTSLDCVDTTIMYDYAKQLNGIAVSIEHRYFGESKPFNASNPLKQPEAFNYLTLDNVMADAASLLESIRQNITGASEAKAIVASGSYGGFLATMLRQNRPDAIWGAIASAPPLFGLSTDNETSAMYGWSIYLNNVYREASAEASAKIKAMYTAVETSVVTGNVSTWQQDLGLCGPANASNAAIVLQYAKLVHANAAEFNYQIAQPGRTPVAYPLEKLINITLASNDPISLLNQTIWMWFEPLGLKCIDLNDLSALQSAVTAIETPIFNYLVCKYFPLTSSGNTPNNTIFPPSNSNQYFNAACQTTYNITPPTATALRTQYHFTDANLLNSTRIIWVNGQYDPTTGCAPTQPGIDVPLLSTDGNQSKVLFISGMAHREDLFAPTDGDRETVVGARRIELETVKGWLGMQ